MSDNPLETLTTQPSFLTADPDDETEFAAWALVAFPSPNKQQATDVPTPPPVPRMLAKQLWARGFRWHPELQTEFPIPGDHPEAGWMNVPTWVSREEYEKYRAEHSDPDAEAAKWAATAQKLLGHINPKLAQSISDMTDEERDAARRAMAAQAPAAFDRLSDLMKPAEDAGGDNNDEEQS